MVALAHGARTVSVLKDLRSNPEPREIGRLLSLKISVLQTFLQEQSIPENSSKLPDTEYLSIAATTSSSQEPQLCAPLILPPAVGCTIVRQSSCEISE